MPPSGYFVSQTPLRIRYAEVDAMDIVHHSNYVIFFEEGRSDYARQRGHPYGELEKSGIYLLVTAIDIRYSKPAHFEDRLIVYTWVSRVQSRGLHFNYEITNQETGEVLVTGSTRHIFITHDGEIARVPEGWRNWDKKLEIITESPPNS